MLFNGLPYLIWKHKNEYKAAKYLSTEVCPKCDFLDTKMCTDDMQYDCMKFVNMFYLIDMTRRFEKSEG